MVTNAGDTESRSATSLVGADPVPSASQMTSRWATTEEVMGCRLMGSVIAFFGSAIAL